MLVVALIGILIKVLEILLTGELRDPWRLDPLLQYDIPVDSLEPWVILNVFCTSDQAAKSLREVLLE